jgi:hypothetical protein
MLYLYGVVRAGTPAPRVKGVGPPPGDVVLVESGPLAVAATEVSDDFEVQTGDAEAHLQVLIKLLAGGPVVPIRMGTVAPDEASVRAEVLDAAQAELVERLEALDGLIELHVDADDDETEAIAAIARSAGLAAEPSTDLATRLDFGQQVAALVVERRQQIAEEIVGDLRPFAVHDVPRSSLQGPEDPVLRWAFLIKREEIDNFDDALIATRSHHPSMVIRAVGPLPPAHFIDWRGDAESRTDSFSATSNWGW